METVTGNAIPSGLEAYELEREIGADHKQALTAAIDTAIRVVEPVVIARVATAAEMYADELAAETDSDDPVATEHYREALAWLAERMRRDLPSATRRERYQPCDGDVVQILISGEVMVDLTMCANCGEAANASWSVTTSGGQTYYFDLEDAGTLKIAKIVSGSPEEMTEET